ncbi:hypothetical protein BDV32DRAFT_10653 [Aspergillus pseudonomiae]|nr:hypothetical protein BDV32DRAFT_10653 [Aspergillus pseudonomiae]
MVAAVYDQWCSIMCCTYPSCVVRYTLRDTQGESPGFFLGASMAGHIIDRAATGLYAYSGPVLFNLF